MSLSLRTRARAVPWLRSAMVAGSVGLALLILAGTGVALTARGDRLNVLAAQAAILGAGVAAAGAAISVATFALSRLARPLGPDEAAELLRRLVIDYESRIRTALLSGLLPADLNFSVGAARRRPTDRRGQLGASLGRQLTGKLLRYRRAGSADAADGSLGGIADAIVLAHEARYDQDPSPCHQMLSTKCGTFLRSFATTPR